MKEKRIFKPLEKKADYNVKDEFLAGNNLDSKILDIAFKSIPLLKDQQYKLDIKNKNNENGFAAGSISIKIPEKKNPGATVTIKIPILIDSFKLKPIDTFILGDVAYPTTDSTIKELLNDPDNFRKLTRKEIRESKILSKIAEDYYEDIMNTLKKMAEESDNDDIKYMSAIYYKSLEGYARMKKESEDYSEPIIDFILKRRPDFNFDLYYIKTASEGGIEFHQEVMTPESIRLLLEATGHKSIKMADEINSGKELYLQAPIYNVQQDMVRSMRFDPNQIKKNSIFNQVEKGPAEIMDAKGRLLKGFVYDLYGFTSTANNFPKERIFIDLNKNYAISSSFNGKTSEDEFILKEDEMEPGDRGVFLDPAKNNAFGVVKILNISKIQGEPDVAEVQIANKKYTIKQEDLLKKYVIDGNEILIPQSYKWIALQKQIQLLDQNIENKINQKIAETSYTIIKRADDIKIVKFAGDRVNSTDTPINIPSDQHLKLLINRLNFITTDSDSILNDITRGIPVTFSTSFPIQNLNLNSEIETTIKESSYIEPRIRKDVVDVIKTASAPLSNLFLDLFSSYQTNPEFYQEYMEERLLKVGATTDTLDTIFSLGIVSDVNSTIFLQNIDKLKFVLSYLTALRLYIRYGWRIGIKEADLNIAIDSLSEIIQKLELIKTQNILDKQLNMQTY